MVRLPSGEPDSAPKELVGRLEEVRCRAGIPSVFLCCAAGRLPVARSLPWERRTLWGEAVVRGRMDGWLGKKLKAGCLSSRLPKVCAYVYVLVVCDDDGRVFYRFSIVCGGVMGGAVWAS